MYTHQSAYNLMKAHLMKMDRFAAVKRMHKNGDSLHCQYRGDGGSRCAVGALIPDSQYCKSFENMDLQGVIDRTPALKGLDRNLLKRIQACHDNREFWEEGGFTRYGIDALKRIADRWGLDP